MSSISHTTEPLSGELSAARLTSGRLLAGNALWNLLGTCLPAIAALFCLPILKSKLGTDRLGVLTLAWAVVGYFGLFDFGLSRALTKLVAQKMGEQRRGEIPGLVWLSLLLLSAIGLVGAVFTFCVSPWLISGPLHVPASLRFETLHAFYWLSFSIPIVVITAGLRGVLEAFQEFRVATAIRMPVGIFAYLGPVLVLPFSHRLSAVVAMLVAGRTFAGAAYLLACLRTVPELRHRFGVQRSSLGPLLRFGGWMTVSNIVGPLMVTFDRFVIGAMLSLSAVAYYAVPYEVVTKLLLVPAAVVGVLFPAFSTAHANDRDRLSFLYASGNRYIFVLLFPITLIIVALAPEGLTGWLGSNFAEHSASVVRLLVFAIFINSLAYVPFAHIQAAGRPDITAKLHLAELPIYGALLFLLIRRMGIEGAAIAWLIRAGIDASILFFVSFKLLSDTITMTSKWVTVSLSVIVLFFLSQLNSSLPARVSLVAGACILGLPSIWLWVLSAKDRASLKSFTQQLRFAMRINNS